MRRLVQTDEGEFKMSAENITMTDLFGMLKTAEQYALALYQPRIIEAVGNWSVTDVSSGRQ